MPPRLLRSVFLSLRPQPLPSTSRTFLPGLNLPGTTTPQTLTATRTLPYSPSRLYALIADIDSYATFVPYCTASTVTHWTPPDTEGRRWPAQATLRVGWGGFEESFASRVRCRPDTLVEARSGEGAVGGRAGSVFRSLVTRWSFRPAAARSRGGPIEEGKEEDKETEVNLDIQFEFANPLYSAVSAAVSDKVAATMIEAFQGHARKVLGRERVNAL